MERVIRNGVAVVLASLAGVLFAEVPQWWVDRGIVDTNLTANDYAPVNQGQAKHVAHQAYLEFDQNLTADCSAISNLVYGFSETNNYLPINLGQLKYLAVPFYDLLWTHNYTNAWPEGMIVGPYPWSGVTNSPQDYALANIGQLKYLFSFILEGLVDSDQDGLPDVWEMFYFGALSEFAGGDYDGDGLTNFIEWQVGTNPTLTDTDGDGMSDQFEYENGLDPLNPFDAMLDPDEDGVSNLDEYLNGTDPNNWDSDGDGLSDGEDDVTSTNTLTGTIWVDTGANPVGAFKIQLSYNASALTILGAGSAGVNAPREISLGQEPAYDSGSACITYVQSLSTNSPTGSNNLVTVVFGKTGTDGMSTDLDVTAVGIRKATDGTGLMVVPESAGIIGMPGTL